MKHSHFGSAANGFAAFLSVLIFGTFWRIAWLHILAIGKRRNMRTLEGLGAAALGQY